jgi:hypothetical protein
MREELRALRDSAERPTRDMLAEVVEKYDHPDLDLARAERRLGRDVRSLLTREQQRRLARGIRTNARVAPRVLPRTRLMPRRGMRRTPTRLRRPLDRRVRRLPRIQRRPANP